MKQLKGAASGFIHSPSSQRPVQFQDIMVANKRRLKDIDQKVERLQSDVSRRELGLEPILTTHDSNRYTLGRDASQ